MKRIAAMAALVVTMLAVPAAGAMASTGGQGTGGQGTGGSSAAGQGPGYGRPGPIQVACPVGHHHGRTWIYQQRRRHGKLVRVRVSCPFIPAKPVPVRPVPRCQPEVLRFDMAAGSSTLTEVSGPTLAPTQEFTYDGDTYTIMSVNPGADSFTVFKNGFLFVNKGDAITGGTGVMCCTR
jgi:hypothetical protein